MTPTSPDPTRSALMAKVRQRGTAPEQVVAALLRELGVGYRRNARLLKGAPDFSNRRRKWAIFVHGCFWHHHTGCPRATVPKTNETFWRKKFADNRLRDAGAIRGLRNLGFRVVLIWECETRTKPRLRRRISKVFEASGIGVTQSIDH